MKRLLFAVPVVLVMGFNVSQACAQVAGDIDDEFAAFRKKMGEARQAAEESAPAAPAAAAGDTAVPEMAVPVMPQAAINTPSPLAATALTSAPASPLGVAAQLPVQGQLPATAYALGPQNPEELAAQMEAEAETQRTKLEEQAYKSALKMLLPLSPEKIRNTLGAFKESREAAETPIVVPEPVVSVQTVPLDPSETPLAIKMSSGYVTTVTILDMTGAPWPIQDISWAGKFQVTAPEEGGHVIRITPQTAHGYGNLSVRLVDLITPVTFQLRTGLDETYYRFDARIPRTGPLAKTPLIEYGGLRATAGTDALLVSVLEGTMGGEGVEKMKIEGVDGRTTVWKSGAKMYLRTPLTLLSPAWDSSVTSADGTNVYTIGEAPVILLSDRGVMVKARVAAEEVSP